MDGINKDIVDLIRSAGDCTTTWWIKRANEAADTITQLRQQIENAYSALGLHPDSTDSIADLIGSIRDEGRGYFHALTTLRQQNAEMVRAIQEVLPRHNPHGTSYKVLSKALPPTPIRDEPGEPKAS